MFGRALILLAIVVPTTSMANDPTRGLRLSTEVTQLYFVNINVHVQRVRARHTWGLLAAYRPSLRQSGEVNGMVGFFSGYTLQNHANWLYQSATLGLTWRHELPEASGAGFLETDLLVRHWWFDRKVVRYNNELGDQFDGLRSEEQDVLALRLLAGGTSRLPSTSKARNALFIEAYGGIGVRMKWLRMTTHHGIVSDEPVMELTTTDQRILPTLHLGMRLGLDRRRSAVVE